jgi:putative Mg2+ transporter-C (MgtC) family protein
MAFDLYHDVIEVGLRLSVATLCGGLIGVNRERKHRPAGLRTLMLVSLGAAAFCLLGDRVFEGVEDRTGPGRVLAGIVGGIGFLGAGTILQSKGQVRGVTTAAAIWVTAGLGSACGLGYYPVAVFGAVLAMIVLWLAPVEKEVFGKKHGGRGEVMEGEKEQVMRESRHQAP